MSEQTTNSSQLGPKKQASKPVQKVTSPPTNKQERKISRRQYFFLLVQTQIGVGVLSLPSDLHQVAKQDGWISLAIAGAVLPVILFCLFLIGKQFPDSTFEQMTEKLFSKWGGRVFSFLYILYFSSVAALIILLFGRMISLWVLPNTPFWAIALCMVIVGLYLANGGLLVLARFYTMVSGLLPVLIILTLFSFQEVHLMYLMPIGESGISKIFEGASEAMLSFFGFFVSLVIFSEVEGKPRQKFIIILLAHFFTFFFYMITLLVSYTFFSTTELSLVPEPLLYMLKSFELPFVARIDLFFISVWFVSVATSYTTYLYIASLGLKQLFRTKSIKVFNLVISLFVYAFTLLIGFDVAKVDRHANVVVYGGYIFSFTIPIVMVVIILVMKPFQKRKEEAS
ncbi:spore germination protein [Halobacillus litoralis]|uniref:GerAB/ArcD/ProY family transporter n=1 Tax=Halobacillus litoralis TaxID=45668 RepID=UPI001CD71A7B|nr:GerAB/ArcD/ProY family transporter [Halobacillus litoralis]MCA0969765.1 spore germination protein [Halobacillus litoralis]